MIGGYGAFSRLRISNETMAIQKYTNIMEGESLLVTPGSTLDEVPSPFCNLVTEEHRAAFDSPSRYFGGLASQCATKPMRHWLELLARADHCRVEINIHEFNTAVILKVDRFNVELRKPCDLS